MELKDKWLIGVGIANFLMFGVFAGVTYDARHKATQALANNNANAEAVLSVVGTVEDHFDFTKSMFGSAREKFTQTTEKITILEESIDPKNFRWAKIKQVREAVEKAIEHFRHNRNLSTPGLTTYASAVVDYSEQFDVPIPLVLSMTQQESRFNREAVSHVGAKGMMQIMPETAKEIAGELGVRHYNMFKIKDNVKFGTYYIMKMLDTFDGDRSLAVRAYNCGPTYTSKVVNGAYKNGYPEETVGYAKAILGDDETQGYIKFYENFGL